MPLNELEKQRVKKLIENLCNKRIPPHLQNEIKITHNVRGNDVVIIETRSHWKEKNVWTEIPVARCKYDNESKTWMLYWQRANGKWLGYPGFEPTNDLEEIIKEIDSDPLHVFWG